MSNISASPKVVKLDAAIKAERDPVKRACLRAERAGFIGRQGYYDEARKDLDKLKTEFSLRPDVSVSIWIKIADGWIGHYDDKPAIAWDQLQRAYALSTAAKIDELQGLSAAWLAHLAYSRNDFITFAKYAKAALAIAPSNFHVAQARLCMVLALSYHYAGMFAQAVPWYTKCRFHAFAENDDGAVSALSFNMAALHGNHAIQNSVFGGQVDELSKSALAGAGSAERFDNLVGTTSRSSWVYMVQAYTYSACGRHQDAHALYESHLALACQQGIEHQRPFFLADDAWCCVQLGDHERAYVLVAETLSLINEDMYSEDRAVAQGRLAQVYEVLGDAEKAAEQWILARHYWSIHENDKKTLALLLEDISSVIMTAEQPSPSE